MLVRTIVFVLVAVATVALVRAQRSGGLPSLPALAQSVPSAQGEGVGAPLKEAQSIPPDASAHPVVDETALRYFAVQGDKRRTDAEIARLRALYPDWVPPTDLNAPAAVGDPELDRVWKLLSDGKFSEARSAITARAAAESGWKPPQDLVDNLNAAEAARRLSNASDAGQWATVLDAAKEIPHLLTCENVDVLWRVAEAFVKTGEIARARDAYRYILSTCGNPGERIATAQKAATLLPDSDLRDLFTLERSGEFTAIRDDLARDRVGKAARDPQSSADPDDLARLERLARDGSKPGDALIVGYYLYSHGAPDRSLEWFKKAADRDGGARAAEGHALAFIALKRLAEAEAAAEPWRTANAANAKAYLTAVTALLAQMPPPLVEGLVLTRAMAAVNESRDALAAQAFGWYAYNVGQVGTAAAWFATSLDWQSDLEPAAFGLALSRQRMKDGAGLKALVAQWRGRSQRIAALLDPVRRATTLVPSPANAATAMALDEATAHVGATRRAAFREVEDVAPAPVWVRPVGCRDARVGADVAGLSPGTALAQGWCLMRLRRPLEAAAAFGAARQRGAGAAASDAAYGQALAFIEAGLTAEAAAAAAGGALPAGRRMELEASIATQRALAAYREGRYAEAIIGLDERARLRPEQTDLLLLRAWSYFNLGRYDAAAQIFSAVGKTAASDEALRGLNAIDQRLGRVRE
jgi:tetratricopeptide (TPR) repeat protein